MTTTVSPTLVHKQEPAEVLLSWSEPLVDGTWTFGIDIPREHSSNPERHENVPVVSGLEVVRQLGLAVGHLHADVPLDWAFILQSAQFGWLSVPWAFDPTGHFTPTALVTIEDISARKGQVIGLCARTDISLGGERVATGAGELRCLPPETYRMLRRRVAGTESTRATTRTELTAVHTRQGELDALLGWPRRDRFLFDHFTDHVPGMLLAQGAISAHLQLTGGDVPRSISIDCYRFAELNSPVHIHAEHRTDTVTTMMTQDEHPVALVATHALSVVAPPGAPPHTRTAPPA